MKFIEPTRRRDVSICLETHIKKVVQNLAHNFSHSSFTKFVKIGQASSGLGLAAFEVNGFRKIFLLTYDVQLQLLNQFARSLCTTVQWDVVLHVVVH